MVFMGMSVNHRLVLLNILRKDVTHQSFILLRCSRNSTTRQILTEIHKDTRSLRGNFGNTSTYLVYSTMNRNYNIAIF